MGVRGCSSCGMLVVAGHVAPPDDDFMTRAFFGERPLLSVYVAGSVLRVQ